MCGSLSVGFLSCFAQTRQAGHPLAMLTEIYIETLLVDDELADQVWEAWDAGEIDDAVVFIAWMMIARKNALRRLERTMNRGRLP